MNDFYQSPADKMRLDILLNSLLEGRLNLAILGHDELALAHYARQIQEHLKSNGQQVELWSSVDSEGLVERFNQILSELTLTQAQDKQQSPANRLYLIFPDTQAIQDFELQLLARLVNGFPASNINVILLINRLEPYEKKLQAFGKNLLQWVLESEHPIPERPRSIEVKDDVPAESPEPAMAPDLTQLGAPVESPLDVGSSTTASDAPGVAQAGRGKGLKLLLLALVISAVAFAGLQWSGGARSPAPAATPAAPAPSPSASTGGGASSTEPAVPAKESLTDGKEELVPPTTPAPAQPADEPKAAEPKPADEPKPAVEPKAAEPKPAAAPKVVESKPVAEPKPAPAAAKPERPQDARAQADREWVLQLKPGQWVLQLSAMNSAQEATAFAAAFKPNAGLHVLKAPRDNGGAYYIVVRGPLPSRAAAETLMKSNPAFAKAWLRSAKSMRNQFDKP